MPCFHARDFAGSAELGQVFVNLLINAAHAMPAKGGEIRITTSVQQGHAVIRVESVPGKGTVFTFYLSL